MAGDSMSSEQELKPKRKKEYSLRQKALTTAGAVGIAAMGIGNPMVVSPEAVHAADPTPTPVATKGPEIPPPPDETARELQRMSRDQAEKDRQAAAQKSSNEQTTSTPSSSAAQTSSTQEAGKSNQPSPQKNNENSNSWTGWLVGAFDLVLIGGIFFMVKKIRDRFRNRNGTPNNSGYFDA